MINKTFNNLMDSIKELHAKKNHDYASDENPYSNFEFAANLVSEFLDPVDQLFAGIIGIKLARLGQLLSGKKPNNESVEDTMRDLTTYCGVWTARRIDSIEKSSEFSKLFFDKRVKTKEERENEKTPLEDRIENTLPDCVVPITKEELKGIMDLSIVRKEKYDRLLTKINLLEGKF